MTAAAWTIRRPPTLDAALIDGLADVLLDCVAGGASVSFMSPLTRERAAAFWRGVGEGVAHGERALLVAEDARGVCGTVQLVLTQPENQPHRADLAKMLVHRRARRHGMGAALLRAAEDLARACGKTLLVLDTASADAERLYARVGWTRVGVIPGYALLPDGGLCATTVYYRQLAPLRSSASTVVRPERMSIDFSVEGKHVLITGGTGGIGAAFAEAFSQARAVVTIADIAPPRADQSSDLKYEQVDLGDDAAVAALAARTDRMDVVIHCAGRAAIGEEYSPIVFNQIVNLHLTGALRLANGFRPHLKASRGCIIHIASMTSYFAAPLAPAYGAAKTAILSLTRTLAVEFAGDGIRVNAIAPGWIDTPLTKPIQEQLPDVNRRILERLPSGRWNTPDELAGLAVFLASPAASILTGVTIAADGGYSVT